MVILCYTQSTLLADALTSVLTQHATYAIGSAESQELKTLVGNQASGFGCIGRHDVGDGFCDCFRYYTNELTLGLCKAKNWTAQEHLDEERQSGTAACFEIV